MYHDNRLFDQIKDTMIMCDSNAEALQLADEYPNMVRFLSKPYQYYLYTVNCRRAGTFAKCSQLWEADQS